MQAKILVSIVVLALATLTHFESFASNKKMMIAEDAMKQFNGVYVNTEYEGIIDMLPQKRIIFSDGKMETYNKVTNGSPNWRAECVINESWTDSNGNIYSTVYVKYVPGGMTSYDLWKLDKTGNILEVNNRFYFPGENVSDEYPDKIDPDAVSFPNLFYGIWYRQPKE